MAASELSKCAPIAGTKEMEPWAYEMSKDKADLGGPAPDFTLASSSGGQIKLSEVVGTAHTILYFFREFS